MTNPPESDFPKSMGNPARNALHHIGCYRLEQLTRMTEAEVLKLHGIGPKAVNELRRALAEKGLAFAQESAK
jgi:DNA-directed RNA polymerase alpha subunit